MRNGSRAVKKLLLLGVGSALMFTMAGVGSAQADTNGSTHKSTAALANTTQLVSVGGGRCASCHRTHTAKAEKLLKQAQPGLCFSCHGSLGSVLDVVDGVDPNAGVGENKALRGGGFQFALINGGAAAKTMPLVLDKYSHPESETVPVITGSEAIPVSKVVTSRHQIDGVTTGTMWGNGAISDDVNSALAAGKTGVTLECGSCHDPHGNGNYRILKPIPVDASTTAVAYKAAVIADPNATPPIPGSPEVLAVVAVDVLPVNIPDAITKVYTTGDYWAVADRNVPTVKAAVGVSPVEPIAGQTDGYITNVAAWCTTCHTRYLAGSGSYKDPLTDASSKIDATFTYRHRSDRTDKDGVSRPNCIQCHVSHGSNVAMTGRTASFTAPDGQLPAPAGLASTSIRNGTTSVVGGTAIGTSRLLRVDNRGTCEMCHNV